MRLEKDVWDALKRALPPGLMVRRIEDMSGNLGTPDVLLMANGRCWWVELKFGGPNAKPDMRPGQTAFALEAWRHGVQSYVLMGHPDGSCKLIDGRTLGCDWKEHLIGRWPSVNVDVVNRIVRHEDEAIAGSRDTDETAGL